MSQQLRLQAEPQRNAALLRRASMKLALRHFIKKGKQPAGAVGKQDASAASIGLGLPLRACVTTRNGVGIYFEVLCLQKDFSRVC